MADIFISYSREDRDRIRPIVEGLQTQGWDVWWDPSIPLRGQNDDVDRMLGSAGAVLVVWSAASRGSEYVRSEAAAGLYKNKLIQARIDSAAPPRPFDQVEVTDLGAWSGDREDANWQRIVAAVNLYAGAPGTLRPLVTRGAAGGRTRARPGVKPNAKPAAASKAPAYLEKKRSLAPAPVFAGAALALAAVGLWFVDPMGWRGPKPTASAQGLQPVNAEPSEASLAAAAEPMSARDLAEADADWGEVSRTDLAQLRAFLIEHSIGPQAESAKAQLRVLDAQAWAYAVSIDTEGAYNAYLTTYTAEGPVPGAMIAAARERLVSLAVERGQALTDIQRSLASGRFYSGPIDGTASPATVRAARAFATARGTMAPDLLTVAPRDLRAFGDLVASNPTVASANSVTLVSPTAASAQPGSTATAGTATPAPPRPTASPTPSAASIAAAEADRIRLQQAQALAAAASTDAETLARTEIERVERAAWDSASRANTAESYRSYLSVQPGGAHAGEARSRISDLTRAAPFAASQLTPELRQAVEAARAAETSAKTRASAARQMAAQADQAADRARSGAPGAQTLLAADGDRYETEVANGAPNGVGVKISGDTTSAGDRYRGELRNGLGTGLGVYEYGENANNAQAGALRYEGDHSGDSAQGLGVTYWRNGDNFAGEETGARNAGRGVLTFANGQRYDGEVADGARNGYGVVWSRDGQILMAGRWRNGELVEPMAVPGQPAPAASPSAAPAPPASPAN
jgi:hypothetical protein